jgi:hypothetical protein
MRMVSEWKRAWRWFSVQAMALAVALQGAWASLPDDMRARLPGGTVAAFTILLLLLGIGGRLVRQRR